MSQPLPTHLRVLLVWLGGVVVVVGLSIALEWFNRRQQQEQFGQLVAHAALDITQRMERLAQGLRATRGAVAAAGYDAISRARFADYAQAASIGTEYAGARGMGFIRHVPTPRLGAFMAGARQEGPPDFSVRSLGDPLAGRAFVIQYIEPTEPNQEAIGLDVASEVNRREAALRSTRLNAPAITAPITLVQDHRALQQSVLIMLPVYRPKAILTTDAQRLEATVGWVYAPLQIEQVLHGLAPPNGLFDFELHDIQTGRGPVVLATSSPSDMAGRSAWQQTLRLPVMGRDWELMVRARPSFVRQLNQHNPAASGFALMVGWSLLLGIWRLMQSTRQKDLALSLQESRMAALVAQSEDAVLAIDLEGCITDWNPAATRIFGHDSVEAVGQPLDQLLVPPSLHEQAHQALDRVTRGESVSPFDTVRLRKDGSEVQVSISISPVRDVKGRVVGAAKISRDISERKMAEARILELNAALAAEVSQTRRREQALLDQALSTVIVTDATGRITLFNHAAERLLGYSADEVVGREVMTRFHDEQEVRQRVRAASQQLGRRLAPGEVFLPHIRHAMGDRNEWLYVHKDGTRIPMLLTVGALHDDQSRLAGFIGIGTDLRDRKKLEADLSEAEKAGRAKDRFMANMSHEMRTPLNAIAGLTYLLSRGQLDSSQQDLLAKTRQAIHSLLALINDVLDLSKIEAGEMALLPQPTALHPLLVDAVSLAAATAFGKPVEVVLDATEEVQHTVLVDALRLQQMLGNLLGNAIKFTHQGQVVLHARAGLEDDRILALRLEVQDTGPGISEDAQQRLFQRFTQASPDIARQFGGTGLGLSIVRHLATLMGGTVGLRSQLGEGSTFWLELSLPLATEPAHSPTPAAPAPGTQRLQGLHILVVDDSAINREVVERILALEGATIQQAANGRVALECLLGPNANTSLVLLDMQMPEADGPSIARTIRQMDRIAHVPILALTASALQSERERALESGMNDFIVKPFEPENLVQRILRHATPPTRTTSTPTVPIPAQKWKHQLVQKLLDDHSDWLAMTPSSTPPSGDALCQRLHRLKGSAGMLGLAQLHQAAADAERTCLDLETNDFSHAAWTAVCVALQEVAINQRVEPEEMLSTSSAPDDSLNLPAAKTLLLHLLEQNSLDAVDAFQRLRPALASRFSPDQLTRLDSAIAGLDFARVKQALLPVTLEGSNPPIQPES